MKPAWPAKPTLSIPTLLTESLRVISSCMLPVMVFISFMSILYSRGGQLFWLAGRIAVTNAS